MNGHFSVAKLRYPLTEEGLMSRACDELSELPASSTEKLVTLEDYGHRLHAKRASR